MEGNQGPEEKLRSVVSLCGHALATFTLPESRPEMVESWRRLKELNAALDTVNTRLKVAMVLNRGQFSTGDPGTSPLATEAVDRLLLAVNNVLALRDT